MYLVNNVICEQLTRELCKSWTANPWKVNPWTVQPNNILIAYSRMNSVTETNVIREHNHEKILANHVTHEQSKPWTV